MVLDAIDSGSKNISTLMKQKLANPPSLIRSFRKQKNRAKSNVDDFYTTINIDDVVEIFEIWKVVLDDNDMNELFIVISAKCSLRGYTQPKWSNVQYRGFYSTVDEAINNIYGYLG
jgi:hypothetical protein